MEGRDRLDVALFHCGGVGQSRAMRLLHIWASPLAGRTKARPSAFVGDVHFQKSADDRHDLWQARQVVPSFLQIERRKTFSETNRKSEREGGGLAARCSRAPETSHAADDTSVHAAMIRVGNHGQIQDRHSGRG